VPDLVIGSAARFARLSAAQQDVIRKAAADSAKAHNDSWQKEVDLAETEALKMGIAFNEVDKAAFRKAVQPMFDDLKSQPTVAAIAEKIQAVK
jgi:TRAP-type C4-dicarboxylate transport system substrate-binding protein